MGRKAVPLPDSWKEITCSSEAPSKEWKWSWKAAELEKKIGTVNKHCWKCKKLFFQVILFQYIYFEISIFCEAFFIFNIYLTFKIDVFTTFISDSKVIFFSYNHIFQYQFLFPVSFRFHLKLASFWFHKLSNSDHLKQTKAQNYT